MNRKILIEVYIPELDINYDLFVPASKKIGNVIINIVKGISELSQGAYPISNNHALMNSDTCEFYNTELNLKDAKIYNGTKLILI